VVAVRAIPAERGDPDGLDLERLRALATLARAERGQEYLVLSDGWRRLRLDVVEGSLCERPCVRLHYRLSGFQDLEARLRTLHRLAALRRTGTFEPKLHPTASGLPRRLEALQVADDMVRFPLQLAFGNAFDQRGYGLPVGGLPNTLPNITVNRAREYYRAMMERRLTVAAVGDLDPEAAADLLAGIFGDLPQRGTSAGGTAQAWAMSSAGERAVDRAKAQTAVAMPDASA